MLTLILALYCFQTPKEPLAPEQLTTEIRAILDRDSFTQSFWGIAIYAPLRGEYLFQENLLRNFRPASNLKLLTGVLALEKLGPDYSFRTTLAHTGRREGEVIKGDLCVRAGGDPAFSGRYTGHWRTQDLLARFANQLVALGLRHVEGDLVADLSFFDDRTIQNSWEWDDMGSSYAVPITPLSLNNGLYDFVLETNRDGELQPTIWPAGSPGFAFEDRHHPDAERRVELKRPWGTDQFTLIGRMDACERRQLSQAAWNPAMQYLFALRQALAEAGISISGELRLSQEPVLTTADLTFWDSDPLELLLRVMMKESQNHYADSFMKTVGQVVTGQGSFEAAAEVARALLRELSPSIRGAQIIDGSGMSAQNNLSPAALAILLRHALEAPYREAFLASMPSMGEDGTLERRGDAALRGRVWAKTGYINRARNLAGYLETETGEPLVFVLLTNNYGCTTKEVEAAQDQICALLRRLTPSDKVLADKRLFSLSKTIGAFAPHSYPLDAR